MSKKVTPVNYLARDFESIKKELVNYAQRYFPDTFKDLSDASFGALMLDAVSYVGDVLSFYTDYQTNETFLETAQEYKNARNIMRQMGYSPNLSFASTGKLTFFVEVPKRSNGSGPNPDLIPIMRAGSTFNSNSGASFTLTEDVEFNNPGNEIIVAKTNASTGEPTSYGIRAHGTVISGVRRQEIIKFGDYAPLQKIILGTSNVTEIVSVFDSQGHQYYQVDHLTQDVIYKQLKNRTDNSVDSPSYILKAISVPRRFIAEHVDATTIIQFGFGSDRNLKNNQVASPSSVVLDQYAKDYTASPNFDPSNLDQTDKLGVAPSNTDLVFNMRVNDRSNNNAAVGTVTNTGTTLMDYPTNTTSAQSDSVTTSLECVNEEPIIGDNATVSLEELKARAKGVYAAQNRAVTRLDYMNLVYRMPPKFGTVKNCNLIQDLDSNRRNMNLYVTSENVAGEKIKTNTTIKNNLKTWLNDYKMMNDTIDILDARIVNFGINYTLISETGVNKFNLLIAVNQQIMSYLDSTGLNIGEPIYIDDLYRQINNIPGVVDTTNVTIISKVGTGYSGDSINFDASLSHTGRIFRPPEDTILEIRFPKTDIKGTIK
tara:strand:+ start:7938 stop:9731 length:1794 start_codon:yes stop_codon:yes gene_type:complete